MNKITASCGPILGLVLLTSMEGWAFAEGGGVPLQANLAIRMPTTRGTCMGFASPLEEGPATVAGMVCNQAEGETAQIDMVFDYRTPGFLSFDEIIERIELTTEFSSGGIFSSALITPNLINLNPNRVSLSYRATLYYPRDSSWGPSYVARVKVFGNYE